MTKEQRDIFLKYISLFNEWTNEIPLTFLLGFYVAMIVRRWWEQCNLISWPDSFLLDVSAYIRGKDVRILTYPVTFITLKLYFVYYYIFQMISTIQRSK